MEEGQKSSYARLLTPFIELFGLTHAGAVLALLFIGLAMLFSIFWFVHSAPPHTITITAGPPGSSFETNAVRYQQILASNGVTLKVLPSEGSLQNLNRLDERSFHVDIGFVQGGITNGPNTRKLSSLGSISYQPLMVFYRSETPVSLLSDFKGKRLAIGPVGSGTRSIALAILALNGIEPDGKTILLDFESQNATQALLDGGADVVFLMGDSASPQLMRRLLLSPGIQILNFIQADGYCRRFSYLSKLVLPKGSIDFGKNIPSQDVSLIGPTVEILARPNFHPALVDLLLEAAQEVHGNASLLKRKGEFPYPLERDFPINSEASRYYKSGKGFLYKYLPFRLASLANRTLVAFVPVVVLLIPGMRVIPSLFRWRIKLHIYRWYRALLTLERELFTEMTTEQRDKSLARLDHIEAGVNRMKVPVSFADQFYALRGYIRFVRERIVSRNSKDGTK